MHNIIPITSLCVIPFAYYMEKNFIYEEDAIKFIVKRGLLGEV